MHPAYAGVWPRAALGGGGALGMGNGDQLRRNLQTVEHVERRRMQDRLLLYMNDRPNEVMGSIRLVGLLRTNGQSKKLLIVLAPCLLFFIKSITNQIYTSVDTTTDNGYGK